MDPLTQQLVQRQIAQPQPQGLPGVPGQFPQLPQLPQNPELSGAPQGGGEQVPAIPPNPQSHVPTAAQRFQNAQQIQDAYRGGWTPNPVLLQATLAK